MEHDMPLVELVKRLGKGATLRERVVRLRYRRKRKATVMVDEVAEVTPEIWDKLKAASDEAAPEATV